MNPMILFCTTCGMKAVSPRPDHWAMHAIKGKATRWICIECGTTGKWFKDLEAIDRFIDAVSGTRKPAKRKGRKTISLRLRTRILERDRFRCRRCGNGPTDARLVIDHIVPVAKGGLTIDTNLQILCEPCNQGKADNLPHAHDLRLPKQ